MTTTPGLRAGADSADSADADSIGADSAHADSIGADSAHADGIGTDGIGTDRPGTDRTGAALDGLRSGTLGWIGRHLDHFDPFAPGGFGGGRGGGPGDAHRPAKAALELALLTHCWTRLDAGDDPRRIEATARVRAVWRHPGFPRLLTAEPRGATQYRLACAALAPTGTDDAPFRSGLARLGAADLAPAGRSPYQRLELRYYADKAGVAHSVESYRELADRNVLVTLPATAAARGRRRDGTAQRPDEPPVTVPEAYALTHSAFYLSDFARTGPGLPDGAVAGAAALAGRLLDHCVRHDWWDLAAELLMTQVCLGLDPTGTPEGAAAVDCLARAQGPDGSIPGRSAATRASTADPAAEYFAKAYHTTLVTALMTLLMPGTGRTQ
ncbi:hypothetical protein SAMN05216371_6938 [Streptomyces sp. TLI_053]|uniref:DUF6895 family protein n=1 Tax=Streptomyces sp. TLI_053 TaxID=1855352 RepID=UPI000879C8E5|nr:hypothetical protein [Streptomyces sp. TLI_053]SDT82030.1 hypothetical protein SAMN05216371_6938 [Streptomyces sp. TLI_053]